MKKVLFIGWICLLFYSQKIQACDVCNVANLSRFGQNTYTGLFYRYRVYNGYKQLGHENSFFQKLSHLNSENEIINPTEKDYEIYHTIEARGYINIEDKWALSFSQAISMVQLSFHEVYPTSISQKTEVKNTIAGIGNFNIGAWKLFSYQNEHWKHNIRVGLLLDLPTGQRSLLQNKQLAHPEVQPGRGFGAVLQADWSGYFNNRVGVVLSANYKYNSGFQFDNQTYRFGNSINLEANVKYRFQLGKLDVLPQTGIYFESAPRDKNGVFYEEDTGGETLFGNVGFNLKYRSIGAQVIGQVVLVDNLYDNQIGNAGRITSGIFYNF